MRQSTDLQLQLTAARTAVPDKTVSSSPTNRTAWQSYINDYCVTARHTTIAIKIYLHTHTHTHTQAIIEPLGGTNP